MPNLGLVASANDDSGSFVLGSAALAFGGLTAAASDGSPQGMRAFPSAEGFGAESLGGRGYGGATPVVLRVTNLNDTGAGSLRAALTASGPRFVVFDVAGTIELTSTIIISNPYLYVAGQTAPYGGICIRAVYGFKQVCIEVAAAHLVFRHLRLRCGFQGDQYPNPTFNSAGSTSRSVGHRFGARHIMWDHCSITWATDGNLETDEDTHNVTIQRCIVAEALNNAGHGSNQLHGRPLNHSFSADMPSSNPGFDGVGDPVTGKIGFVHRDITDAYNLIAHADFRCPQISTTNVEVINNVVHDTMVATYNVNTDPNPGPSNPYEPTSPKVRILGNWIKRGQRSPQSPHRPIRFAGVTPGADTKVYVYGNVDTEFRPNDTEPHYETVNPSERQVSMGGTGTVDAITITDPLCTTAPNIQSTTGTFEWPTYPVTVVTAAAAYASIITAVNVGATKPMLDEVDARIIARVPAGTSPVGAGGLLDHPGQLEDPDDISYWGGYPDLAVGGSATLWSVPANAMSVAANGYLVIENNLNALAGDTIP